MKIDFNKAAQLLEECQNAYIIIHRSPDGDCIGSGMALYYVLRSMGKKARVICSDELPARYKFMCAEYSDEEFEPDFIISTDVADAKLMGKYEDIYGDKVDLCIDHHISNTFYAENTLVCPDAAATCEVLYEIIKLLKIKPDEKITRCIYTGIATDTGCFKYENTTARCHEIVAELKRECHINYAEINRNMFEIKSMEQIKLENMAVSNMEYYLDGKCTVICITADILEKTGVNTSDLEGIAGLPLQIEGAEVGITIKQRDENSFKVSMRSANDVNVSEICALLGGGGHIKAAGCLLYGTIEEVKKTLVDAVAKGMGLC